MDNFEVVLLSQALKFYKDCPTSLIQKLNKCFETLEKIFFFGTNIKLLKTKKRIRLYRYRVGDHRVIYEIDKKNKRIGITLISSRPSAYRDF